MLNTIQIKEVDLQVEQQALDTLKLLRAYAMDIMGGGQDLSDYVKSNLIAGLQKRQGALVLLAYELEKAVGLAIAFEGFSTFYARPLINIHDFVVAESHRGKGIARQMLEKIENIAIERGCCKLTLEVLEGNIRARKVYKSFGFDSYILDERMGKALFLDKKLRNI